MKMYRKYGDNYVRLHRVVCVLGETYKVIRGNRAYICKFIKVTNKGYNFLHEESNMCLFPKHWYVPREWQNQCQGPEKHFWVPYYYDAFNIRNLK